MAAESNYTATTMAAFPHQLSPIPFSLLLFRELGSRRALYISWEAFFYSDCKLCKRPYLVSDIHKVNC